MTVVVLADSLRKVEVHRFTSTYRIAVTFLLEKRTRTWEVTS